MTTLIKSTDYYAETRSHPFYQVLAAREIPDEPPEGTLRYGLEDWVWPKNWDELFKLRSCVSENFGMWAIVDKQWTAKLAAWLDDRHVLEIMAGRGWLAKALSEHGVNVAATDNFSWHSQLPLAYPVEHKDALEAVKEIPADVLIVSWPHMDASRLLHRVCRTWGPEKPIVYIGEGDMGCNAQGVFWRYFKPMEDAPEIVLPSYPGIHDYLTVGRYSRINKVVRL